jgi:hypothetical protein
MSLARIHRSKGSLSENHARDISRFFFANTGDLPRWLILLFQPCLAKSCRIFAKPRNITHGKSPLGQSETHQQNRREKSKPSI